MITTAQSQAQDTTEKTDEAHFSSMRILRNVFSNWLGLGANVLIAFFMSPFVVHHLGDNGYGVWALVLQLTGYMGVVDVGLRSALVRFISRFHAQCDNDRINQLLSSTFFVYAGAALICSTGGLAAARFAMPFLHIPADMRGKTQVTLVLAAIILGTDFLFAIFQAALAGVSRWDLRNGVAVGVLLLRTALVVVLLRAGYGLVTLALIQLLCSLAGHLVEVVLVKRLFPFIRISTTHWQKSILGPVLSHSSHSFLISIGGAINYEVDSIVIALFLPVSQVTFYVIGARLVQYLRVLINGSAMIVAPLASALDAQGRGGEVGGLLKRGTKYTLAVAYFGIAFILCLGPDFIRVWMGAAYGPVSGKVLRILATAQFVSLTELMAAHLLYGLGKHRVNAWCTLSEAALNLGASLVLIRFFGIYGVAAGTALSAVLVRGIVFPTAFLRVFQVRWREYLISSILPCIGPTLAFVCGSLLMKRLIPIHGYGTLLLSAAAGSSLFFIVLWGWTLSEAERRGVSRMLAHRVDSTDRRIPVIPATKTSA